MSAILNYVPEILPEIKRDFNILVYESTMKSGKINDYFTVKEGVQTGDVAYLNSYSNSMIGKKRKGNCELNEQTLVVDTKGKKWELCDADFRIPFCADEIEALNPEWKLNLRNGIDRFDISSTEWMKFVEPVLIDKLNDMHMRYAWFGNSVADEDENLTCDVEFFEFCDGVFQQIALMKAAGEGLNYVTIANNEIINHAIESSVNTFDVLQDVILKAHVDLRSAKNQRLFVSQAFLNKFESDLINQEASCCTENARRIQRDGISSFFFLGYELEPVVEWDRIITKCFDGYKPFRVLLTTKDNLQYGTASTDRIENYDMFLDKKSRKYYIDGLQRLGTLVLKPELVSFAM